MNKVVLVGTGAVGTSFLYAALNQNIQAEYILIDIFTDPAKGHAYDLTDAASALTHNGSTFKVGTYKDCKNANLIVITAGRPQKSATESRLDMVSDNAKIIAEIGKQIKSSGFKGVTIIASNPCDVMATTYAKVTGFSENLVFSSGTMLDTVRLKRFLAASLKVNPDAINGFVLGEHGDKSIPAYSCLEVGAVSLSTLIANKQITNEELKKISQKVINEAYEIIRLKRATYYGIGACLACLANAVLNNTNSIFPVGIKLDNSFKYQGIYFGYPAIIGQNGWKKLANFKLSAPEQKAFDLSAKNLKEFCEQAFAAAKI